MDSLLNRYRNITVLLLVIFAQLVLLAYQVKGNQDVRLIRVWAVTAVTPLARVIEGARSATAHTLQNYVLFRNLMDENRQLKAELGKLKLENVSLRNDLETADRVKAMASFQEKTPSKTIPARVIGTGTGANARMIFVDRGSAAGVMRGMAVITPDGIVGKVTASYPTASQVLLITDPAFAAGVISQKHRVHGTVRGLPQGGSCRVDYIQNEEKVEPGEVFFTSGDDRIFPKGFPVGVVSAVRVGHTMKEIMLRPTGVTGGLEEVLIVIEGAHQAIPEYQAPTTEVHLTAPPPPDMAAHPEEKPSDQQPAGTEADRLRDQYRKVGEAQNHVFGEGLPGSKPPDFTKLGQPVTAPPATGKPATPGAAPGVTGNPPAASKPEAGSPASGQGTAPGAARPGTGQLQGNSTGAGAQRPATQGSAAGGVRTPAQQGNPAAPLRRPEPAAGTGAQRPATQGSATGGVRNPAPPAGNGTSVTRTSPQPASPRPETAKPPQGSQRGATPNP